LQWKTSIEIKNAYFEVQKSLDGRNWSRLLIVQPQQNQVYECTDHSTESGTRFYRIRQVDLDGGFTYTGIKFVRVSDNGFQVWPNPATSVLYIQSLKPEGRLQITDMNGKLVYDSEINNTLMKVPVQHLRTGQYIIMIRQNGEVYTKPFIRE
jgi:Secretion system C-terminal sorting domain